MKRRLISAALALSLSTPLFAADWNTQSNSTLGFQGAAQGETFNGVFKSFNAKIRFDPADLTSARFDVEIDLTSLDSQNSERDEMLADSAFFDSGKQPKASYIAEQFEALADGRFRADGTLTLRGVSKPVPLTFSWQSTDGGATLKGEATLDRIAFEVGGGEWADADTIAHEVRVTTELSLKP